jgi:hypothetical protein
MLSTLLKLINSFIGISTEPAKSTNLPYIYRQIRLPVEISHTQPYTYLDLSKIVYAFTVKQYNHNKNRSFSRFSGQMIPTFGRK